MPNLLVLKKAQNIRLSVFPGSSPNGGFFSDRELSYLCWRSVWGDVFKNEMKLQKKIFSDEFSRQDMTVSLFCEEKCVGLAMIRLLSFNTELTLEDSFFRFWTPASLKRVSTLCHDSPLALASAFTVHPDFRGRSGPLNWKSLLLGLFLKKFLTTKGQIMVTAARKVRSNEKLCQSLGAQLLEGNVPYIQDGTPIKGEIADLLYWPRNIVIDLGSEELNQLIERIWIERNDGCEKEGEKYAA